MGRIVNRTLAEIVPYDPLTKEQSKKITELWALYKNGVGLEGEYYLKLVSGGMDPHEAIDVTRQYFTSEEKKRDREAWLGIRMNH